MLATRLLPVSYIVRCTDGPATDNWRVHRFHMREAINEPYQILLEVVADEVEVDVEGLLGASVEVELERGEHGRVLLGVVTAIDWLGLSVGSHVQLRLDIRPAFALLEDRVHSRLWQDASVLEIVDEVLAEALGEYGRSHDLGAVTAGQSPRSYCVQYNESDLAFVSRLLEEEGISYHFVHDPDKGHEVLTLFDAGDQLDQALNVDDGGLFPLIDHDPDHVDVESVQTLEWHRRLTSTGVLRRDFDWREPTSLLSSEAGEADDRGRSRRIYVHGQRRFERDDQAARAGERKAAETLTGVRGWGRSNAADLRAGKTITVEGHELAVFGEDLVLVSVEHQGGDASALMHGEDDTVADYRNFFECVPAGAQLRPRPITPKPRVHGPQTAIVCGAAGEEIDVDEHGRIRVQFHWQETPTHDARASCWVRVAQSWAGPGWGAQFIPRIGMEVVVEFLEGNPDRPLVTGCVYNGANPPPFALPDDKTQSGIRTQSSPGGGGSNELRFEDAAGAEEIYLHGQKDWTIAIEHDKAQTVGHDESLSVGNDRSKRVGNDEGVNIGHDQRISVGHDESESVGNDLTLTVGANQTVTVGANQTVTIAGNRAETIGQSASETVAVAKAITVGAAMQLSVGGALNQSVGAASAEQVGGSKSTTVGGNQQDQAGGNRSISAGKDVSVTAGKKGALSTGDDLTISAGDKLAMKSAKDMAITSGSKGVIECADKLTLKCGKAQIVLSKNGEVAISGGKITIKGSKDVIVKGAKVKAN